MAKKFSKAKVNYRKHERKELARQSRRAGKKKAQLFVRDPNEPEKTAKLIPVADDWGS